MNKFPANDSEVHTCARPDMPIISQVHQYLGCKEPLTVYFIAACFAAIQVFDYKQRNYGSRSISKGGSKSVALRMGDKVERIKNLLERGIEPQDETIEDSFGDAGVYGLIGLMVRWGWWPKETEKTEAK